MNIFPTLLSKRLQLRARRDNDRAKLLEFLSDLNISKMLTPISFPYSKEEAQAWIDFNISADPSQTVNWVIDDGSGLIGTVGANNLNGSATFGYWLGKPFWGQGCMSEAAATALHYLFHKTDQQLLRAGVFKENPISQRILTRLDFEIVGEELKHSRARGEKLIPHYLLELSKARFRKTTASAQRTIRRDSNVPGAAFRAVDTA